MGALQLALSSVLSLTAIWSSKEVVTLHDATVLGNANSVGISKQSETPVVIERDCEERFITQRIDHFNYKAFSAKEQQTFQQRYFVCKPKYWRGPDGPIFFYTGNEASVELYVTHTGLMWENAPAFGALMVFAEHRYFGKSTPFGEEQSKKRLEFCTIEQALADYAELILALRNELEAPHAPVITFGGSYGGMLSYWMRYKYPSVVSGAIAASAPVLGALGDVVEPDTGAFARIVTKDATSFGYAADSCAPNMHRAFQTISKFGESEQGRTELTRIFRRCKDSEVKTKNDAMGISGWVNGAIDYMAMGSYPYPSSYLLNGKGMLPAYPVAAACKYFEDPELDDTELLEGVMAGINMYYNNTGDKTCFGKKDKGAFHTPYWSYLACTEIIMPITRDGVNDMYYEETFNATDYIEDCKASFGVTPNLHAMTMKFGGRIGMQQTSNVIFTNGDMDPWAAQSVLEDVSQTVISILIPHAGHHEDLMFTNERDPPELTAARRRIISHMRRWVLEALEDTRERFVTRNVAAKMWRWRRGAGM